MQGLLFWVAGLSLFTGVVLGMAFSPNVFDLLFSGLVACGCACVCLRFSLRTSAALILIAWCACGVGVVRSAYISSVHTAAFDAQVGQSIEISGRVALEPDERETSTRVAIDAEIAGEGARVLAVLPPHTQIAYGDTVVVRGTLQHPESFITDTARVFEYPQYLAVSSIGYMVERAVVEERIPAGPSVRGALFAAKEWYLEGLGNALPEPSAALAGGITVGDKRALGGELSEVFRDAGLIHIVVLSGYNITIIIVFLLAFLARMHPTARITVGTLAILLFVLMTGAGATSVRAGIMAFLGLLALTLHRRYAISRALVVAAALMALWNPRMLLYDPGFQLSVLATLGLIHVAPLFEKWCSWVPERFGAREIFAATIGTQLSVLLFIAFSMGSFSLVALPVNLVVLPFVPVAMLLSFVAGIIGAPAPFIGPIVGLPAHVLLHSIVSVAEFSAGLPFASVVLPEMPLWVVAAGYASFAFIVWRQTAPPPPSN